MNLRIFLLATFALSACSLSASAQTSSPSPSNPSNSPAPGRAGRAHSEPCWQQAGIDKSVMQQRWAIERETHAQVEAVCTNSSLSPQQKLQQVRELHREAKQKSEGLITPAQEKALQTCRQEMGANHPSGAGLHGAGPCGATSTSGSPSSQ